MDYPHLHRSLTLRLAIKATNDTIGIGGIAPSMLAFGFIPRFPITSSHLPEQADRMRALQVEMMEMNAAVATERISEVLRSQVPSATGRVLREGDEVMTYREKDKIWYSGFTVRKIHGKQVTVIDRLGEETNFSLHLVKLAPKRGHVGPQEGAASVQLLNREGIHTPHHSIHYVTKKFRSEHHIEEKVPLFAIHIPETIKRNNSPGVQEAMKRDIEGIVDNGTWAVTVSSEVPTGANVLNGRFVVTIKDVDTEREIYKARYVVQCHRDKEKTSMVHHNTTARQQSTRLLIGLAAIFGFRVCTHDVQQAYFQSAENLLRDVYLKPSAVLNVSSGTMLKLLRPLYGLCDAGDYWARTILDHLAKDLNLVQTVGDSGLFFQTMNRKLVALTASFVDDLLMAGTKDFHDQSLFTSQRFKFRDRDYDNVKFAGVKINKTSNGFEVHQHN
jgi:Reverse transcriptase (RNA-dependent DNA polymerase)